MLALHVVSLFCSLYYPHSDSGKQRENHVRKAPAESRGQSRPEVPRDVWGYVRPRRPRRGTGDGHQAVLLGLPGRDGAQARQPPVPEQVHGDVQGDDTRRRGRRRDPRREGARLRRRSIRGADLWRRRGPRGGWEWEGNLLVEGATRATEEVGCQIRGAEERGLDDRWEPNHAY